MDSQDGDDKMGPFLEWLQINGAQLHGCKIRASTLGGFGIYSTADDTNGIIFVVPLKLVITPMTVLQDPLLGSEYGRLFEQGDVDDRFLIILFLLVERKRKNSFWTPYLDVLPNTFSTPLWFKDDELNELKGTALYHATIQQLKNLKALFNDKVKHIAESFLSYIDMPSCDILFEDFLWANSIFWSRGLTIPFPKSFVFPEFSDESEQSLTSQIRQSECSDHCDGSTEGTSAQSSKIWIEGLAPGIDFCNHIPKGQAVWEVDDESAAATGVPFSMYLTTGSNVCRAADEEIRISYGNKGNEELLFLYGFVIQENPDEFLMLHYPKQYLEQAECGEMKSQLLDNQKLGIRWLLPKVLLSNKLLPEPGASVEETGSQASSHSWSGHRQLPKYMAQFVFPEDMMASLRTLAMTEADVNSVMSLLSEISVCGRHKQPTDVDIKAAIWEVCGDMAALQLLVDLLTAKLMELEETTGTEANDRSLLTRFCNSNSFLFDDICKQEKGDPEKREFTKNKWAAILYRKGQKHLAKLLLKEAENFLQLCLQEELGKS